MGDPTRSVVELVVVFDGAIVEVRHLRAGESVNLLNLFTISTLDGVQTLHTGRPIPAGRLDVGLLEIHLRPVAAPLPLPRHRTIDVLALSAHAASFAAFASLLALLFTLPPEPPSLSLDQFRTLTSQVPRVELRPPPVKPHCVPGPGGRGTIAARGDEGRVRKGALPRRGPGDARAPRPHRREGRLRDASGVLGALLGGAQHGNLFGCGSALGDQANSALDGLAATAPIAPGLPDAPDYGGVGLFGSGGGGSGWGGTIALGRIPPQTSITLRPHLGDGYGRADGVRCQLPKQRIRGPDVELGPSDTDYGRRVARAHLTEIRRCYERALVEEPLLQGRVVARILVGSNGRVLHAMVGEAPPGAVRSCIADSMRTWQFPPPRDGPAVVTYPFTLRPAAE